MFALPRRQNARPAHGANELPPSHLGRGLKVSGVLEAEGELIIHGFISGRINADRLIIAADGNVEGDIVAKDVRVAGRLNGRIFALIVTVEDTADITGRIFHHTLTVARGARFDGRMPWRPVNYFENLEQLPETQP